MPEGPLIHSYALRLFKPRCNVFSEAIHAKGLLTEDLSPVMPYLNAVVKGCKYARHAPALTLPHDGRTFVLWPKEIALDVCDDEGDARRLLDAVCAFINDVWARRDTIEPNYESPSPLTPLGAYRLLPGTNCRECGEAGCLAFAVKLASEQAHVTHCTPLFSGEHEGKRSELLAELVARGYPVDDLRK